MSHLITDLGLGNPAVTVERLGNGNVTVWRARCDCGHTSKVHPRISLTLEHMTTHGELHRVERQERAA